MYTIVKPTMRQEDTWLMHGICVPAYSATHIYLAITELGRVRSVAVKS